MSPGRRDESSPPWSGHCSRAPPGAGRHRRAPAADPDPARQRGPPMADAWSQPSKFGRAGPGVVTGRSGGGCPHFAHRLERGTISAGNPEVAELFSRLVLRRVLRAKRHRPSPSLAAGHPRAASFVPVFAGRRSARMAERLSSDYRRYGRPPGRAVTGCPAAPAAFAAAQAMIIANGCCSLSSSRAAWPAGPRRACRVRRRGRG